MEINQFQPNNQPLTDQNQTAENWNNNAANMQQNNNVPPIDPMYMNAIAEPSSNKGKIIAIISIVVGLILIIAAAAYFYFNSSTKNNTNNTAPVANVSIETTEDETPTATPTEEPTITPTPEPEIDEEDGIQTDTEIEQDVMIGSDYDSNFDSDGIN